MLALACTACRLASTPADTAQLVLLVDDADVWAFEIALTGRLEGGAGELVTCAIDRGDVAHPANTDGRSLSATVPLEAGLNVVTARCLDSRAREYRSAPVELRVGLRDVPEARPRASVQAGQLVLDASESAPRAGSDAKLVSLAWFEVRGSLASPQEIPLGQGVRVVLPLPTGASSQRYALHVRDDRGREERADLTVHLSATGALEDDHTPPTWLRTAVVYGVIPPLNGDPPLRRTTERLDELAALGVDTLWLSPIFGAAPDDFGYAPVDFFHVRESFGSAQDLSALTAAAHARGLRVLLDLVVNHSSREHPYYQSAETRGERSHYRSFYDRDAAGTPTHYFDWEHLPNLNFANPEVQTWVLAFAGHWLRDHAIDGYRVDAAWGVRTRQPDFYLRFAAELGRINPDAALIAEASARDPYYVANGFDAAYDWTDQLGHHAWEHVFDAPTGIARRLADALAETEKTAPYPARTLRFLNNNDTGARFITRHGEPLTRVATAALLTLPGIPCVYAFDEAGGEFEPYSEQRPNLTPPRPTLRDLHHQLITLRKHTPALHAAGYLPLAHGDTDELLAFIRFGDPADGVALVALNFGATPVTKELTLPAPHEARFGKRVRDALGTAHLPVRAGKLKLQVPPFSAQVLVATNSAAPRPR